MSSAAARTLIWLPIVHSAIDLGSLHGAVRRSYVDKAGRKQWQRHSQAVDEMWRTIRRALDDLELDYPNVRLYQDGLPVCGYEEKIVRDLAQSGSANYALLLDLMARGAKIVGTESPELLLEEYVLAQQTLSPPGPAASVQGARRQRELSAQILEKRDRFIAARIDETLRKGETGLIFVGMFHSLEGRLPPDIRVVRLDPGEIDKVRG